MPIPVRSNCSKNCLQNIDFEPFSLSFFSSETLSKQFLQFYDYYVEVCTENLGKDDQPMNVGDLQFEREEILFSFAFSKDPFGESRGSFQYASILTRLQKLKNKLESEESSGAIPQMDSYTKQIIDAAELNSNISSTKDIDLEDIFNNDDDEEEEEDDEEELQEDNWYLSDFVKKNEFSFFFFLFFK